MITTGTNNRTTRDNLTFIDIIIAKDVTIRNTVRNTSSNWVTTKLRITSTSEVHLCMISPVWF